VGAQAGFHDTLPLCGAHDGCVRCVSNETLARNHAVLHLWPAPRYCESLQPGKQASASSRHTSSSSSNTSTSTSSSASSSSSSSEADYLLVSTTGDASPALPPVLDFKCKKFHFRQLLDHFTAKSFDVPADSAEAAAAAGSPGVAPLAASRRLLQQQWRRWWRPTGQQQQQQQQQGPQPDEPATFTQVYWVCGDAWPRTKQEQVRGGPSVPRAGSAAGDACVCAPSCAAASDHT
jgi:hypothetical protein